MNDKGIITDNLFKRDITNFDLLKDFKENIHLELRHIISNENYELFSFINNKDKQNEKDLVFEIFLNEKYIEVSTGNYVGNIIIKNKNIPITSRFSENLLYRMLNYANDIYINSIFQEGEYKKNSTLNFGSRLIYYYFLQSLDKALLLGFPKSYMKESTHSEVLRGSLDLPNLIKKDFPYKGKISTISRLQVEAEEIIDVIYATIKRIEKDNFPIDSVRRIFRSLKEKKTGKNISNLTIQKAVSHRSLLKPQYFQYKKVLRLSKIILESQNLQNSKEKKEARSFLINVASLFEVYLFKLFKKEFEDWLIESPSTNIYEDTFFERKIIPDIVFTKENEVCVFDVKYKTMTGKGRNNYSLGDLDRNDFFQIHTYINYYQSLGKTVKVCGLLYPCQFENDVIKKSKYFGLIEGTTFLVTGIDVSSLKVNGADNDTQNQADLQKIIESEESLIKEIRGYIS